MSESKIVGLKEVAKEIHQLLIWTAGREQPVMLAYRKYDNALKAGNRACSFAPITAEEQVTVHDDFDQVVILPQRPVAIVITDPGRALELQMELTMMQQIAQARFQAKAQADPTLRAVQSIAIPSGMMPRG